MKVYLIISLLILVTSGCATSGVRDRDLVSWNNHSESELNKHPLFSTLPRDERPVNKDEKIVNFVEKKLTAEGPSRCFGASSGFGVDGIGLGLGSSVCDERQYRENNCVHQFTIREEKVTKYQVLGENNCQTTCKNTPEPGKCKK